MITQPDTLFIVFKNKIPTCNDSYDGEIKAKLIGGNPPYTYLWSTGATDSILRNLHWGIYTFSARDDSGCIITKFDTLLSPNFKFDSIIVNSPSCYGYKDGIAIVYASGGNIVWGDYTFSNDSINYTSNKISTHLSDGIYYFYVKDKENCRIDTTIKITQNDSLILSCSPLDTTILIGAQVQITTEIKTNHYINNIEWKPKNALFCYDCLSPIVAPYHRQIYNLEIRYDKVCIENKIVRIHVIDTVDIWLPNSFTPNGDALNPTFNVYVNTGIKSINLRIFNRWGEKVFETNDVNIGWDGLFKGVPAATGIYTYSCQAITLGGREIEKKGTVNLLK